MPIEQRVISGPKIGAKIGGSSSSSTPAPAPEPEPKKRRLPSKKLLVVLGVVVVLAAAAGAWFLFFQGDGEQAAGQCGAPGVEVLGVRQPPGVDDQLRPTGGLEPVDASHEVFDRITVG